MKGNIPPPPREPTPIRKKPVKPEKDDFNVYDSLISKLDKITGLLNVLKQSKESFESTMAKFNKVDSSTTNQQGPCLDAIFAGESAKIMLYEKQRDEILRGAPSDVMKEYEGKIKPAEEIILESYCKVINKYCPR